ncbi:hypothetical protein XPA_001979 [Xanthoria parietina]
MPRQMHQCHLVPKCNPENSTATKAKFAPTQYGLTCGLYSRNRSLLWLSNSIVPLGQHTPASSSLFIGFKWWVETSISDGREGRYPQGKLHVVDDIRAWTKPRLHLLVMSREI